MSHQREWLLINLALRSAALAKRKQLMLRESILAKTKENALCSFLLSGAGCTRERLIRLFALDINARLSQIYRVLAPRVLCGSRLISPPARGATFSRRPLRLGGVQPFLFYLLKRT